MSESNAPTPASTDEFVAQAHAGQLDKQGRPYIRHVRAVAYRLRAYGQWAYMAALLHDWVEDCEGDLDALYDMGYPDAVVEAVDAVSRLEHETYEEFITRACADPLGCLVKFADNTENLSDLSNLPEEDQQWLRGKYVPARTRLLRAMEDHERAAGGFDKVLFGPPMPNLGRGSGTGHDGDPAQSICVMAPVPADRLGQPG